jgi:hypothetical protein
MPPAWPEQRGALFTRCGLAPRVGEAATSTALGILNVDPA